MEILVKVQIDLSADAKSFLASLIGNVAKKQDEAAPIPTKPISATPTPSASIPVASKANKSTETKVVPPPAKVETTQKPVAEVKPTVVEEPQAASSTVTLADVRAAATPLIENYRSEIMTKLRSFGAVSVSTLDSKYFVPMIQFLNTLK